MVEVTHREKTEEEEKVIEEVRKTGKNWWLNTIKKIGLFT